MSHPDPLFLQFNRCRIPIQSGKEVINTLLKLFYFALLEFLPAYEILHTLANVFISIWRCSLNIVFQLLSLKMKNLKVRNHLATISSPPLSSFLLGLPASNTSIYPLPFSTLYCITIYTWFNTSQLFLFLQIWQMGLAVNENTCKTFQVRTAQIDLSEEGGIWAAGN